MHDVNRHVGHFGERDRPMCGFGFGPRRPRQRVIFRRCPAFGKGSLHEHVDDSPVLRMHADRAAIFSRPQQRREDARIVQHENAGIRHEQLERRHALPDQGVHLGLGLVVDVGHDHVEAVIDDRLAFRLLHPGFPGVMQRLPAVLNREIDDGGCPSERGGCRS